MLHRTNKLYQPSNRLRQIRPHFQTPAPKEEPLPKRIHDNGHTNMDTTNLRKTNS